jgi:hypothetical protein
MYIQFKLLIHHYAVKWIVFILRIDQRPWYRIYIALRIISTILGIISTKLPFTFSSFQKLSNASMYQPGRRRYYINVCVSLS